MKLTLLSFLLLTATSIFAQKAPTIGITDFNQIQEHEEATYSNDTWINNLLDTGWDITGFDNNGEFNQKKFPTGGINQMDGCISIDNLDIKYVKIKSNDQSAFKLLSIYLKPDANLNATFKGYLNGVEVASTVLTSRTPERWSIFELSNIAAFGNINELRIFTNVRTHFMGIDQISIALPELNTEESSVKNTEVFVSKNQINIQSKIDNEVQIFSMDGKQKLRQSIKKGNALIPTQHWQKGVYIVNFLANNYSKKIIID